MNQFEEPIFGKKTMSDLYKEIYENSRKKEAQISALIQELKPLITDIGEATLIVPLIKEYLEVGVKNDEHLIKLAGIIQRAQQRTTAAGEEFGFSEAEKEQLFTEIKAIGTGK